MKKILALAILGLPFAALAQKIDGRLKFQKGQKIEIVQEMNSVISQAGNESKVNITVTRLLDVNDASDKGASLEHKIKRVVLNYEIPMMGSESFDSEKESDMKGEAGKAMEKSLKNKYAMTLDPYGKVVAAKADDDNKNSTASPMDMGANLLAQAGAGLQVPEVGSYSEFTILPAREVAKGESWTDSTASRTTTYTLSDIVGDDVLVSYTENNTISQKQEIMGMEANMNSKEKTTGTITLDRKTGLIKNKKSSTDSEGTISIMGQTMPMNTRISRNWTVKAG